MEIRDPPLEVGSALLGQFASRIAAVRAASIQMEQFIHFTQGEPELLGTLDEDQQVNGRGRVVAITARSPRWFSEQTAALVIAQRLGVHASTIRQLSGPHDPIVNPVPNYGVNPGASDRPVDLCGQVLVTFPLRRC